MATTTTNYGFNISEGTDLVNPLMDIFPNWTAIDSDLKAVSDRAIGTASELLTGTVHALTRTDADRDVFVFTATSNFTAGDTFTLDGVQVSALTPAGEQLATGCYIIGSDVIVSVHGTLMTMYVSPTKVADSDKLDGHDSTYFATASDLGTTDGNVSAISTKVGTGVLTTTAQDCVGAINELKSDATPSTITVTNNTDRTLQIDNVKKIGNVCYVNLAFAVGSTVYNAGIKLATLNDITANGRAYLTGYLTNGSDFAIRQLMIENGTNEIKLAEFALLSGYSLIVQGCFVTN